MDVRKKVLLDLFASPGTLLPTVGGLSALILSWAMDGGAALNFIGLAGILGGVGWFVTRLILDLENITNRAYDYVHAQKVKQQEESLDELDARLRKDRDPRTEECLRRLRDLYGTFVEDVRSGKITRGTQEVTEIVDELFRTCVGQLELSYQLWQTAVKTSGPPRDKALQDRNEVVEEVIEAVRQLDKTIQQFLSFTKKKNQEDLGRLRGELDEALRVARRTEERMASWEQSPLTAEEREPDTKTEPQ